MPKIDKFDYLKRAANHNSKENRSALKPNELGVLLAVVNYADTENGRAHPSIGRLASELGVAASTVSRTLAVLCDKGWLRQVSAGTMSRVAAVYELSIPTIASAQQSQDALLRQRNSDYCASATVTIASAQPDRSLINQKINQRAAPARETAAHAARTRALREARRTGNIAGLPAHGFVFTTPDYPDGIADNPDEIGRFMAAARMEWINQLMEREGIA